MDDYLALGDGGKFFEAVAVGEEMDSPICRTEEARPGASLQGNGADRREALAPSVPT